MAKNFTLRVISSKIILFYEAVKTDEKYDSTYGLGLFRIFCTEATKSRKRA